jgi:hypothetical protein
MRRRTVRFNAYDATHTRAVNLKQALSREPVSGIAT